MYLRKDQLAIFFGGLFFLIMSMIIVSSFLVPLFFTLLLVYVLNPVYNNLKKILKSHTLVSLLIIFVFVLFLFLPFAYMIVELVGTISSLNLSGLDVYLIELKELIFLLTGLNVDLISKYNFLLGNFESLLNELIFTIPIFIFQIFLIIFFYYYFSKEHNFELFFFKKLIGFRKFKSLHARFDLLIKGIIYGQIFVRFIQAVIALLGFLIFGIDNAIILAILMFFASFLPLVGTGLIWIPVALFEFFSGDYLVGILVLILGLLISLLDNLLLPYLISEKVKVGPVMVLISILGGIEFFGFYGILLGPFCLGAFFVLLEDLIAELSKTNPNLKKFVWSESERKKYRSLNSQVARDEYSKLLNQKYKLMSKS